MRRRSALVLFGFVTSAVLSGSARADEAARFQALLEQLAAREDAAAAFESDLEALQVVLRLDEATVLREGTGHRPQRAEVQIDRSSGNVELRHGRRLRGSRPPGARKTMK